MYARFTIHISGNKFIPSKTIEKLKTLLVVDEFFDSSGNELNETSSWGDMYLIHKNEFSKEFPDIEYEESFVNFFSENYDLLKENGATNFSIFIEIYYADQCNFEIFNRDLLVELAKYKVSLPISVYHIQDVD